MKKKINISFWTIIFLLLLPILFFPLSPDTSIYLESGKIIANGGKPYIDTIDLKQPLIYYLSTLIYLLFGYHEISIRLFDFIWQFATIVSLYLLISKTNGQKTAIITAIIYSISYTALGYSQISQCETFAALPIVWLIYFRTFHRDKFLHLLFTGILTGIISGFKFTLSLIFLAIICDIIFTNQKKIFKTLIIILSGAVAGFFFSMLPLVDGDVFKGYVNVLEYLSYYSSIQSFGIDSIKLLIKNSGAYFGDRYSLLFTLSLFTGIYLLIKKFQLEENSDKKRMMNFALLSAFFLFLSVVWEGRYWDYHIARMYVPLMILSGIGLISGIQKVKVFYSTGKIYLKIVIVIMCFFGILFSPFSRWVNTLRSAFYYFTDTEKYDVLYSEIISYQSVPLRKHHKTIAKLVNKNLKKDEMVLVISTGSNAINFFLNTDKVSAFRNSQFIFNHVEIEDWKNRFKKELNEAIWIIVQTDDSREDVIGEDLSSWELLQKNISDYTYLIQNFKIYSKIGNFLIFGRHQK